MSASQCMNRPSTLTPDMDVHSVRFLVLSLPLSPSPSILQPPTPKVVLPAKIPHTEPQILQLVPVPCKIPTPGQDLSLLYIRSCVCISSAISNELMICNYHNNEELHALKEGIARKERIHSKNYVEAKRDSRLNRGSPPSTHTLLRSFCLLVRRFAEYFRNLSFEDESMFIKRKQLPNIAFSYSRQLLKHYQCTSKNG